MPECGKTSYNRTRQWEVRESYSIRWTTGFLNLCAKEFEQQVADLFKAQRSQTIVGCEIPILGWVRGFEDYSPHAPRQQTLAVEQLVVRALLAREWFKLYEAPAVGRATAVV